MAEEETKQAEVKEEKKSNAKAKIPAKFDKLIKDVESLSVLELSELVKVLEDHFNVSAAAPAAAAPQAQTGGDETIPAAEEKKEFSIELKDAGANKINVIKAVREITGLGLAESKAMVDGAPKIIKEKAPKDEAETAKAKLEEAGATVELS